jgi:phosphoglycerate dehydrogenase-like enzyme
MSKPKVLYIPTPSHTKRVFRDADYQRMCALFDVTANPQDKNPTTDQVAAQIKGFDALVTGWGVPPLTSKVFESADQLRIIAHSAGSVKGFLPQEVVDTHLLPRRIVVFSANHAIAYNVAEYTVGMLIVASRRIFDQSEHIHNTGGWKHPEFNGNGQFLQGSVVGVVSASKVGREVIRMLQPFDVHILVYDPYLSDWDAGRLGVEKTDLDDLFSRSDTVTVHAPNTPETQGMIGARQLKRLREGALFVNCSRGAVLNHDALYTEAASGRIRVVLDVTTPEPLPPDSPFRKLPNVILTPHVSGAGYYGYHKIGSSTLQALEEFFSGRPVTEAVPFDRYATLA